MDNFRRNLIKFSTYRRLCVFDVYDRSIARTHDHLTVNKDDIAFKFLTSHFERS